MRRKKPVKAGMLILCLMQQQQAIYSKMLVHMFIMYLVSNFYIGLTYKHTRCADCIVISLINRCASTTCIVIITTTTKEILLKFLSKHLMTN